MQGNNKFLVEIAKRRDEATNIIGLDLVLPNGGDLPPFEAGAHIDVRIDSDFVRQYSLCNAPSERHRYQIAVLKDPESRGGSIRLHELFIEGRRVYIKPPKNFFPLDTGNSPKLLIAGGIGVTPLLSMAWTLHARRTRFNLIYCARSRLSAAFVSELVSAPFARSVETYFDDRVGSREFDGRSIIREHGVGRQIYVCGPVGFIDHVTGICEGLDIPSDAVHVEHFDNRVDHGGDSFTVFAKRSGVEVRVRSGDTIADALLAAGVDLELSCEQGVCGTCIVSVLDGAPDHRDLFLDAEEKLANDKIAPCCSRSKSSRLVLDI